MMPFNPNLPWGTYIRCSSKDQGEKSSPLKQLLANVAWAKNQGHNIPGVDKAIVGAKVKPTEFVFVDMQSGTSDDRPDLQRCLDAARAGKLGGIVTFCVDRSARNLADALKIKKLLTQLRVQFQFATQTFDDTPHGHLMFQVFGAFAEFEARLIRERTGDGMLKRANGQGSNDKKPRLQSPGAVLFGYKYNGGLPERHDVENPVLLIILRAILDQGETSYAIAAMLNRAGHRTRKGCLWCKNGVAQVARHAESYAGMHRHRHGIEAALRSYRELVTLMRETGNEPPPIDLSTVQTIQSQMYPPVITTDEAKVILARIQANRLKRGQPTKRYPLSGLIWCLCCKRRWRARSGKYLCSSCERKPGQFHRKCSARQVQQKVMDPAVIDGMLNYLEQPDVAYAMAMQAYEAIHGGDTTKERRELERRLAVARKQQSFLDQQLKRYDLPQRRRDLMEADSKQVDIEIATIQSELRAQTVTPLPSKDGIVAAFSETVKVLRRMETFEEKREFLEATVQRIETDGHEVRVMGQINPNAQAGPAEGEKPDTYRHQSVNANVDMYRVIPFSFNVTLPKLKVGTPAGIPRGPYKRRAA